MNGILLIDKPAGITSHDVVYKVRRILRTKRVGHTGTLDPFATGLMVILVGQATRLARFLDKDAKEYEAIVRLGFETDTGDRTGARKAERGMRDDEISALLAATDWDNLFSSFTGEIGQIPPMYSAKKVDGKKLYELARKGETVERQSVRVRIDRLELVSVASALADGSHLSEPPASAGGTAADTNTAAIYIACSAGTYIRTLAEDIGRKLGTGAHLAELRRTAAGKFSIQQAVTIAKLAEMDEPATRIIPMEQALTHLAKLELTADRSAKTRNGLSTRVLDVSFTDGEAIQMLDESQKLIAIGFYNADENVVQPKVVLI